MALAIWHGIRYSSNVLTKMRANIGRFGRHKWKKGGLGFQLSINPTPRKNTNFKVNLLVNAMQ